MKYYLSICLALVSLAACSTTNPIITANPDQTTATSGTIGSSRITNGEPRKYTDTLTVPTDSSSILKQNRR